MLPMGPVARTWFEARALYYAVHAYVASGYGQHYFLDCDLHARGLTEHDRNAFANPYPKASFRDVWRGARVATYYEDSLEP